MNVYKEKLLEYFNINQIEELVRISIKKGFL
jgi:hypothetical protein